jgi:hypothetical protein
VRACFENAGCWLVLVLVLVLVLDFPAVAEDANENENEEDGPRGISRHALRGGNLEL